MVRCTISVEVNPKPNDSQLQSIVNLVSTEVGSEIRQADVKDILDYCLDDVHYRYVGDFQEMFRSCSEKFSNFSFRMSVYVETNSEEPEVTLIKNGKILKIPSWLDFLETKINHDVLLQWKHEYDKIEETTLNTIGST